ncbi:MAG: hypothetical protein GEV07_29925 [Streptosporangiales bacterium]|nr:hypothetical protein [Streptosporangiales bacterium]
MAGGEDSRSHIERALDGDYHAPVGSPERAASTNPRAVTVDGVRAMQRYQRYLETRWGDRAPVPGTDQRLRVTSAPAYCGT